MDESSDLDTLREEMSHVPLSELKAMQDKLGLKAFNKIRHGISSKKVVEQKFKRENKNRPSELSARRPVPKQTPSSKSSINRDPRFDDLSGEFNEVIFKQTYGFLSDVKVKEKMKLKKMISKTQDKQKKSELKQLYNRMEQQEQAEKRKAKEKELEKEWKKKQREQIKEGKKPFFLKKSERKALLEAEHRKELEESGKIQKHLKRKSKKLSAKEKRKKSWSTKDIQ